MRRYTQFRLGWAVVAAVVIGGAGPATAQEPKPEEKAQPRAERQAREGQILKMKEADVRGAREPHRLVLLQVQGDERLPVDLGPASAVDELKLKTGEEIRVSGRVVSIADKRVLVADEVTANGKTVTIDRTPASTVTSTARGEADTERRTLILNGGIIRVGERSIPGLDDPVVVALIDATRYGPTRVILGSAGRLEDVTLGPGDRVRLFGHFAGRDEPVFIAQAVWIKGPDRIDLDHEQALRRSAGKEGKKNASVYLGLRAVPVDGDNAPGLVVVSVRPDSPAERAGLKPGDRILEVGGRKVTTAAELAKVVAARLPGEQVRLVVVRGGQRYAVDAKLEGLTAEPSPAKPADTGKAEPRADDKQTPFERNYQSGIVEKGRAQAGGRRGYVGNDPLVDPDGHYMLGDGYYDDYGDYLPLGEFPAGQFDIGRDVDYNALDATPNRSDRKK